MTHCQVERSLVDISSRYIRNFDALYMMALVETALPYEVRFLREAIWQHYARQISLKVTIPVSDLPTNRLYFNTILYSA